MAAAPWRVSQVPWRRPPGGGMRGPHATAPPCCPFGVTLRRRPVPLWGFPSAHPGGRPCPVSRDRAVWPQGRALWGAEGGGNTFPARGRVPGLLGSRSGLQGQRLPVSSREGAGRTGERGAGGATTVSSAPGTRGRGPSL